MNKYVIYPRSDKPHRVSLKNSRSYIDEMVTRRKAKKKNATNRNMGKLTPYEIDFLGVMGELAWSHFLRVPFDDSSVLSDGGHDLTYCGRKIDVKCYSRPEPDIMFNRMPKRHQWHYVALSHGNMNEMWVDLYGLASFDKFNTKFRVVDFGYGRTFLLDKIHVTNVYIATFGIAYAKYLKIEKVTPALIQERLIA